MNSDALQIVAMNKKSGQKVARNFSRSDARYWLAGDTDRLFKPDGSADYCARIQFGGRRERFGLGTSNANNAAKKAAQIYTSLKNHSWTPTLIQFKPKATEAGDLATVGEWLAAVEKHCDIYANTLQTYAVYLRRLASDIAKIKDDGNRYASQGAGYKEWLKRVDGVKLEKITSAAVNAWRIAYAKGRDKAPDVQRRATNSARSIVRNSKSLFGRKIVKRLRTAGYKMPDTLPFADVDLPELFGKKLSTRYVSKFNAGELLGAASAELAPTKPEAFKALLLALLCGLRRREIDSLTWSQCDLTRGTISLEHTAHIRLKTEESANVIELDTELLALMRGWKAAAKGPFVVEPGTPASVSISRCTYRVESTHDALIAWLNGHGITARKPLHELRKEAGNLIASANGIFAASRFLRHSNIAITSDTYADKPQRITTGLGAMLPAPDNVTPFPTPQETTVPTTSATKPKGKKASA